MFGNSAIVVFGAFRVIIPLINSTIDELRTFLASPDVRNRFWQTAKIKCCLLCLLVGCLHYLAGDIVGHLIS